MIQKMQFQNNASNSKMPILFATWSVHAKCHSWIVMAALHFAILRFDVVTPSLKIIACQFWLCKCNGFLHNTNWKWHEKWWLLSFLCLNCPEWVCSFFQLQHQIEAWWQTQLQLEIWIGSVQTTCNFSKWMHQQFWKLAFIEFNCSSQPFVILMCFFSTWQCT